MSLFWATILSGLILIAIGGSYFLKGPKLKSWSIAWPRSQKAAIILFGPASLWFLWLVLNLSKADFGDYKKLLLMGFGAVAIGSFFVVRDFLAARGLAVLMLLAARPLLDAAYMQFDDPQRLLLVVGVYIGIILALWVGASPFRMRDFYTWLYAKEERARTVGGAIAAYGIVLTITAFTY
ncbi:hypothetical protein [Rubellicoccus peritrichatus]|uniref:Uncharacterized protein n=1 Tax=Rubellicoccus peritrichatus TaxID=3080537 RepID=A0AAQ3LCC5_9BACT|nr:hypothetical protein [Puniceicoccus sp. CR14]WOO41827.1 hypothetical protein RZN69_01915 [Puniceicoccus sp. CR14]